MIAIKYCYSENIIKMLLDADADVNIQTCNGWTVLILIVRCPYGDHTENIVRMLLEKSPDLMLKNIDKITVYQMAKKYGSKVIFELIE